MVCEVWCEHGSYWDERPQTDGSVVIGPRLYPCVEEPAVEVITNERTTIYCVKHTQLVIPSVLGMSGMVVLRRLGDVEQKEDQ